MKASSEGRPRYWAEAPVAMISAVAGVGAAVAGQGEGALAQLHRVDVVEHDLWR